MCERNAAFRHTDEFEGVVGVERDAQRAGIREADVFGSSNKLPNGIQCAMKFK